MYYVGIFNGYKAGTQYLGLGIGYNGTGNNDADVYGWSSANANLNHDNSTVNYARYLNLGDTKPIGGLVKSKLQYQRLAQSLPAFQFFYLV